GRGGWARPGCRRSPASPPALAVIAFVAAATRRVATVLLERPLAGRRWSARRPACRAPAEPTRTELYAPAPRRPEPGTSTSTSTLPSRRERALALSCQAGWIVGFAGAAEMSCVTAAAGKCLRLTTNASLSPLPSP